MGIYNVSLLKPDGFPLEDSSGADADAPDAPTFFVGNPNGNGVFTITGPSDVLLITGATTFTLNTPSVTDHGDGSYTAASA